MSDFHIMNGILLKYRGKEDIVTVPDGVTKIDDMAFARDIFLAKVTLPEGLKEIGRVAFAGCRNLLSIRIPDTVTKIGSEAFYGCYSLTKIRIPDGVRYMDSDVFLHCRPDLLVIHCNAGIPRNFGEIGDFMNLIYRKDFSAPVSERVKYSFIWLMFDRSPEDTDTLNYIREHFSDMFRCAIERNQVVTVQNVLDCGEFVHKGNIDEFIQYAIEKQAYDVQLALTGYKEKYIGYDDTEESIRRKFEL